MYPRRAKVVIVEDDEALRELLAATLRMHGYYVRTAADGLSGLRVLEVIDADVIVLDLRLPLCSGFEMLHEVRSSNRRIPVIAISGDTHAIDLAKANPDVFITLPKPFDPEALVHGISRATQRRNRG